MTSKTELGTKSGSMGTAQENSNITVDHDCTQKSNKEIKNSPETEGGNTVTEIIVAVIALAGTAMGSLGGILAANRLTNYRIGQLEKKVDKHNSVV